MFIFILPIYLIWNVFSPPTFDKLMNVCLETESVKSFGLRIVGNKNVRPK